jgi:hypothetical protein
VITPDAVYVGIIKESPKYQDLLRDGRYVLHAVPGPADAEFWIEGRARLLDVAERDALRERIQTLNAAAAGPLFELDLASAHGTIFSPGENNTPIPDRRHWHAERNS